MIVFGFPEIAHGFHLCHHFARPQTRGIHIRDCVDCDCFLCLIGVVDRRTIRGADVVALAVDRGRIMDLEKELQNLTIGGFIRVKQDLDAFGMGAVVAIGGIGHIAAGIADACFDNAGLAADQIFHAPETATGQYCAFTHATSST